MGSLVQRHLYFYTLYQPALVFACGRVSKIGYCVVILATLQMG